MANHILKCPQCNEYMMCAACKKCGSKTISTIPASYSPEDKYGKYRREAKKELFEQKGLI